MKIRFKYNILLIVLLLCVKIVFPQTEQEKRAMWIFHVAYAVEWQNEDQIKKYRIGVYSNQKEYEAILSLVEQGRNIKGKPVEVIRFRNASDIVETEILYITKNNNASLPELYPVYKDFKGLVMTDRAKEPTYTTINFLPLDKGTKRFEINTKNAENHKMVLSKTVLKLGGSEDVLRDLYREAERRLQVERKLLDEKQMQIKEQQTKLDKSEAKIKQQKEEMLEKERELKAKEYELKLKNMQMDSLSSEKEKLVKETMANKILNDKIKADGEKLKEKNRLQAESDSIKIAKAKEELIEIEKKKKEVEKNLGESEKTVGSLTDTLYVFIGLFALIVFLAVLALFNIRKKKQINKKLNEQNVAINKQKEEILDQSRQLEMINVELEKLSIVADKTDNAVTIMDEKGNFIWVNAGFTRLYGYTLQLLKNELDENITKASPNKEIKTLITKCINNRETIIYENKNTTRAGEDVWVQTTVTPIVNEEGVVTKLISIDTDISRLKVAEQEIREQHKMIIEQARELEKQNKELEKLSLVASETDNAILLTDAKGKITWINDAFERMFGYNYDYLVKNVSETIYDFYLTKEIIKKIEKSIDKKTTVDFEFKAKNNEGKEIWIHTTLTPILNKLGEVKTLIAIDSDITKLKLAEFEIRQKSEELFAQGEELKIQNEKIEFQNKHIHSSIKYALNIQKAMLPTETDMTKFFNSFTIFKPKDIVSGDFYWIGHMPAKDEFSEKVFAAVVDCTGHGVPGAFMSMIGNRLLNEIVIENKITSPNQILEALDKRVKKALRQDENENNDGMDLCLVRVEKINNEFAITFAGAKRPLYYHEQGEKEIRYLKADRRSIGGTMRKRTKIPFTNQELTLQKGDKIWLSTDGLIDQNDNSRRRFGSLKLMQILDSVCKLPLAEQEKSLMSELSKYQGDEEQRDDITLIGVEFSDDWK